MNHRNVRMLTALSIAVLWLPTAHAQYPSMVVKVNIPFNFSVNNKPFPSGEYSVLCTPVRLDLRDSQAHVVASLFTHRVESLESAAETKLQFSTDGGYALIRLWIHGERIGYELSPSKTAAALAKLHSRAPVQISGGGNRP
jgi:hypothetical protein